MKFLRKLETGIFERKGLIMFEHLLKDDSDHMEVSKNKRLLWMKFVIFKKVATCFGL